MAGDYEFFWQSKSPFSNWYPCTFIDLDGVKYSSTEQYVMYKKSLLFGDNVSANLILSSKNPKFIKDQGRRVINFDEKKWKVNREKIMYQGNLLKFTQNEDLKQAMLDTGDRIFVEASPYDRIWGVGLRKSDPRINNPKQWKGLNLLGICLTRVKHMIRKIEI